MSGYRFVPVPEATRAELAGIVGPAGVVVEPKALETLSLDFYWYSPVLKARLADRRADVVVRLTSREQIAPVLAACHRAAVPVTVRGAGTGNYGQCVPLHGGVVVDLSGVDRILSIADGVATTEPGARLAAIETAARPLGWELRCYPSTWVKATVGGFIAGGSGGIGSITWGGLADMGTIKRLTVVTCEATPRRIVLDEEEALTVFHTYGTNGVIEEVELRLAPAVPWDQVVVCGESWDRVLDFAEAVARDDAVRKRLVTVVEAPLPDTFKPILKFYPRGRHVAFLEVESGATEGVKAKAVAAGVEVPHVIPHHEPRRSPMLSDYTWNHTTLWALRADPSNTYLQAGFGPDFRRQFALLRERFPGEVLLHLEFVRGNAKMAGLGPVSCGSIPVVRFTSEARLRELIEYCREIGVFIADPHTYLLEDGGRNPGMEAKRALKERADPANLLNPGKLKTYPNLFAAVAAAQEA